jgi:hypothetical protein
LIMGEMWEAVKAEVYAEDQPEIPQVRERAGIQEVARTLINLGRDNPEGDRIEIQREERVAEIAEIRREEHHIVVEERRQPTTATQQREERPPAFYYDATDLRPPSKTGAESRKRRGTLRELADEETSRGGNTPKRAKLSKGDKSVGIKKAPIVNAANTSTTSNVAASPRLTMSTRQKRRPSPDHRMRGWLPLNEDKTGFVGIEVRASRNRGGGLGVFVADGYELESGATFPYFGIWGPQDQDAVHDNHYLVGPYRSKSGTNYIDGNPTRLANSRNDEGSALWAGPRVNQANTPEENNCRMVAVSQREVIPHRAEYAGAYAEPVRCGMSITRVMHAGEEVLTNYGWDRGAQMERRCGYDYHEVVTLGREEGMGAIQDHNELDGVFSDEEESEEEEEDDE